MDRIGPEPRLATRVWVQAQVRLCDINFIPVVVTQRGDPDAGSVIVRLSRENGRCILLRRHTGMDGGSVWGVVGGEAAIDDQEANDHIERECARDPDIWLLEVDDPKERYWPDRPIAD